jgi:hypothetical protein
MTKNGVDAKTKKKIEIFVNRRKFETTESSMTPLEILALAGYDSDTDLYLLKGEGDPSGGELLPPDQPIELKNGIHFRAVPRNANFG